MEQDKDDKDGKQIDKKASFRKRICAYFIDILIVSFLASLIALPFIDAKSIDKMNKNMQMNLQKPLMQILQHYRKYHQ